MQVLRDIRSAEDEAERVRRAAAAKAREIVSAAQAEVVRVASQGQADARSLRTRLVDEAAQSARDEAAAKGQAHAAQLEQLRAQGRERLSIAADLIVERTLGHGNR